MSHAQTMCPLCIIPLHNYFRININNNNNNNTILSYRCSQLKSTYEWIGNCSRWVRTK